MTITNVLLSVVVIVIAGLAFFYYTKKKKEQKVEATVVVDDKTYTLDVMKEFVKKRLDEITKVNLYDIGLSEEELKRKQAVCRESQGTSQPRTRRTLLSVSSVRSTILTSTR